jgi:hypothetical protein
MRRRAAAVLIHLAGIGPSASAAPPPGRTEATAKTEGRMVDVAIDLQDGFKDDTVVIRAAGRALLHDQAVSTRFQIGKAKSATLALPEGEVALEIEVPTRNQRTTVPIDTTKPTFVGISLTTAGELEVRVQEQPFGYM